MPEHISHWKFQRRARERKMHKCCVWRNLVVPEEILLGSGIAGKNTETVAPPPDTSVPATSTPPSTTITTFPLLSLPNELIENVFAQLDDNSYDMICLSLTCRQLLRLGFNRKTSPAFTHRCHGTCISPLKCAAYWGKHRRIINGFRDFLLRTHLSVDENYEDPDRPAVLCAGCFRWQSLDILYWEAEARQFYALDNTGLRYITLNSGRYLQKWCSDPEEVKNLCPRCGWHQFLDTIVNGSKVWTLLKDRARVGRSWSWENAPLPVQHWVDMVENVDEDGDGGGDGNAAEGQEHNAFGEGEAAEQQPEHQGTENQGPSAQQTGDNNEGPGPLQAESDDQDPSAAQQAGDHNQEAGGQQQQADTNGHEADNQENDEQPVGDQQNKPHEAVDQQDVE